MTPAEFSLFPARSNGDARKPQNAELERQEECLAVNHLTTLRSAAFWELRRSVIENGEGLIRRMRDYELSRLHHQVCQKAKERKKRGRKSTLSSRCKTRPNVFEASDEDDVLICSEDTSNGLSWWSPLAGTRSLDSMDVDGQDQLGRRDSRSMPGADYSQAQFYYDMGMSFTRNSFETEEAKVDLESRLSYPDSASPTPSSSSISLLLPPSLSMTSEELLPLQTSSSEKALLELNVAFANGACSITDYSPVWRYQQQFNTDEHDNGDLWR
jgi:hypothetical protein